MKFLYEHNYEYASGWYILDKFLNIKLSDNLIKIYKLPNKNNTIREALIYIIENNFILYDNFIQDLDDFTYDILSLEDSVSLNKYDYVIFTNKNINKLMIILISTILTNK